MEDSSTALETEKRTRVNVVAAENDGIKNKKFGAYVRE